MGRPPKRASNDPSTRDRIFDRALELFAERGFDAVSIRGITRSLGLNEATLYIYFTGKSALLEEILAELQESLIKPGFRPPPTDAFVGKEPFDLGEYLVSGAEQFFLRADYRTKLTWRLLMMSQYRFERARTAIEQSVLDAPAHHFAILLQRMKEAEHIPASVNCESLARTIAALFFEYSFRANLLEAWGEESQPAFDTLCGDIRNLTKGFGL